MVDHNNYFSPPDYPYVNLRPFITPNRVYLPEILALQIYKFAQVHDKIVLHMGPEGYDIQQIKLEYILKNICDEANIQYDRIEIHTRDLLCKTGIFKVVNLYNTICPFFYNNSIKYNSPKNKKYGIFLGRGSNERMYLFNKHLEWQYNSKGIANYNCNIIDENETEADFLQFALDFPKEYNKLKHILPMQDVNDDKFKIGESMVEINDENFWYSAYEDICIEIVSETNVHNGTFFPTEKIIRPINFGRLFVTVASPNFEKNLKKLGIDIFDDIIDKSYDSLSGYMRIDALFQTLKKFLDNPVFPEERIINNITSVRKINERLFR
tara:strand:- start:18 stop:989 length:972 start_codon:yes stop_codon:yes gene_type:complete